MKAILRTNDYTKNYEIVEVVRNPISKENGLAEIIDSEGEIKWTGGILVDVNESTLYMLDLMSNKEQWDWLCSIKAPKVSYIKGE